MPGISAHSKPIGSPESRAIVSMLIRRARRARRELKKASQTGPQAELLIAMGEFAAAHNAAEEARRILYGHTT